MSIKLGRHLDLTKRPTGAGPVWHFIFLFLFAFFVGPLGFLLEPGVRNTYLLSAVFLDLIFCLNEPLYDVELTIPYFLPYRHPV